jgi:Flp pilus assembly CpaF family ATPase
MSLETILSYVPSIAPFLANDRITDIAINPNGSVCIQEDGQRRQVEAEISQPNLKHACKRIAKEVGETLSEANPILDARLPDGSRVSIKYPPVVENISLVIRKFRPNWYSLPELVVAGMLTEELADTLTQAVLVRENILIAGGTGSGKSTLTKALIDLIPRNERLEVIEDTRELKIDHVDVVQCEAQREQRDAEGNIIVPARTIRDLVKASLRDNPDRIIIGEVRGAETLDLLDSANTGHAGSISTLHANSALDALSRLETMAAYADVNLPHRAIQLRIGNFADLVLHVVKKGQRRFVSEAIRVHKFDLEKNDYRTERIYERTN